MAFFSTNFMLQSPHSEDHQPPPTSLNNLNSILSNIAPQDLNGINIMPQSHSKLQNKNKHNHTLNINVVNAGNPSFLGKRSMSFSSAIELGEEAINGEEDFSDDGSQANEKKRRLNIEQVKTLEKSFELGNKLEPERKLQLARALNLQPRQIAIWFQNRRARWKTKQLEKDYDVLKRQYDAMKLDNDSLQTQNQKLQAEILALKNREPTESINLNKETEGSCSNRSENSSEIKLDISRTPASENSSKIKLDISRTLFPPSATRPSGVAQLFQTSSRPELQCQKIDQMVKEESLSNMFCGMEDQTGFWPWLEQQQFN